MSFCVHLWIRFFNIRSLSLSPCPFPALLDNENELTHNIGAQQPIVLSTRIRLARNLSRFPFPGRAKGEQRREIARVCREALETLPKLKRHHAFAMRELTDVEKLVLVERHLISRELSSCKDGVVVISRDQTCSVMINEEDHLRIQVVRGGFQIKRAWKQADALDSAIEAALDFAVQPHLLGYLTACPTNVGTGLRASAMLHLPGLVMAEQMDKVMRALNQDGLAVRGWFGEGSEAVGSIFQISNQQTLGPSEADILKSLSGWLKTIIEQEENARLRLLENDPEKFFDKLARSFGTLRHARLLSSAEAMNLLSLMRLACDMGMFDEDYRAMVDRLIIENQPGHIQIRTDFELDAMKRDFIRAAVFRESFKQVPDPSFDIIDAGDETEEDVEEDEENGESGEAGDGDGKGGKK